VTVEFIGNQIEIERYVFRIGPTTEAESIRTVGHSWKKRRCWEAGMHVNDKKRWQ